MGHYDELCLVCGISPIQPSELFPEEDFAIEELVELIQKEYDEMDADELREILKRRFQLGGLG